MSKATETVAEMLYDEYTGSHGKFATSTQRERWIKWAEKIRNIFATEKAAA